MPKKNQSTKTDKYIRKRDIMAAQEKDIPSSEVPYRQIRAVYDDETITVYQAYSPAIATAAVREQKLSASKEFSFDRYTWIKPSWCWMMFVFLFF